MLAQVLWISFPLSLIVFWLLHGIFNVIIKVKGYKWWYWNVYLRLPNWRLARRVKFFFSGHHCKFCGVQSHLDIHHKNYAGNRYLEWLTPWTLEVLCRNCHHKEHPNYQQARWQIKKNPRPIKSYDRI